MTDLSTSRPLPIWPLKHGETLANHDWFPFYVHEFLGGGFVLRAVIEGRRADIGTAMILLGEAMRQNPAGTLPDDDVELAALARFGSLAEWQAVRTGVLSEWRQVKVEDDERDFDAPLVRLGHAAMLEAIVADMNTRKRGRAAARAAGNAAVRRSRVKQKLQAIKGAEHYADMPPVLDQLLEFFDQSDLYITTENVRIGLRDAVGVSMLQPVKGGRSGR